MIGSLRRKVCEDPHEADGRTMEKDDYPVQIAFLLHKWWLSTENAFL